MKLLGHAQLHEPNLRSKAGVEMSIEIMVPTLGESVVEATVGRWFKQPGDAVKQDEALCELETDKVTIEVLSTTVGVLSDILVGAGQTVAPGAVLAIVEEGAGAAAVAAVAPTAQAAAPVAKSVAVAPPAPMPASPAARKILEEKGLAAADVDGSGKRGQVLKGDAIVAQPRSAPVTAPVAAFAVPPAPRMRAPSAGNDAAREERVPMTRLRQTIARRLKEAQNTAAMLTTYNDVDMSAIMALRAQYKDIFEKRHGTKLGFMGFFVRACIQALREIPAVNAEIDGTDIVYKNYYHIGVAVGTDKGLVVPVVREADRMSLAEIEGAITNFGRRARDGKLGIDDMQGGTFTISNGGVYGSMMSMPILNAPQSGILGMHKIEDRPVARGGQVVIRPMMYLALSYDHRIVDGKEAVTFLVRVKECLEDPQRFMLEL